MIITHIFDLNDVLNQGKEVILVKNSDGHVFPVTRISQRNLHVRADDFVIKLEKPQPLQTIKASEMAHMLSLIALRMKVKASAHKKDIYDVMSALLILRQHDLEAYEENSHPLLPMTIPNCVKDLLISSLS